MSSGIDIRGNLHNTSGVILNYAKKKTSSVDNTKMRTENDKDNYNLDFSSGNIKNTFTLKNNRKPNLNIRRKSLVNNRKDRINIKLSLKKQKIDNFQGIVNFLQQQKIKNQNKAKPINTSLKESLQYIVDTNLRDAIKEFQQIKI